MSGMHQLSTAQCAALLAVVLHRLDDLALEADDPAGGHAVAAIRVAEALDVLAGRAAPPGLC